MVKAGHKGKKTEPNYLAGKNRVIWKKEKKNELVQKLGMGAKEGFKKCIWAQAGHF